MFTLQQIRERLEAHPVTPGDPGDRVHAAVALVVCDAGASPEVLFIERATNDRDPWSGHLGFPGGRIEPGDAGARQAAERETREEIDLDLARAEYLGRLDDLPAAYLPVVISCFVYAVRSRPELTLEPREVADAFWFSLADLADPARRREAIFSIHGQERSHPAIQVLEGDRPYLWGITCRLVTRFLEVLGCPS